MTDVSYACQCLGKGTLQTQPMCDTKTHYSFNAGCAFWSAFSLTKRMEL